MSPESCGRTVEAQTLNQHSTLLFWFNNEPTCQSKQKISSRIVTLSDGPSYYIKPRWGLDTVVRFMSYSMSHMYEWTLKIWGATVRICPLIEALISTEMLNLAQYKSPALNTKTRSVQFIEIIKLWLKLMGNLALFFFQEDPRRGECQTLTAKWYCNLTGFDIGIYRRCQIVLCLWKITQAEKDHCGLHRRINHWAFACKMFLLFCPRRVQTLINSPINVFLLMSNNNTAWWVVFSISLRHEKWRACV